MEVNEVYGILFERYMRFECAVAQSIGETRESELALLRGDLLDLYLKGFDADKAAEELTRKGL